jgi:hypothetical protein
MILKFGLSMESLSSCIFLSQLLNCLTKIYSAFNLISILSSISGILSPTWSTLLQWLSTVFFVWLKGLFIPRISVWFFFLRFYISLFNFFLHFVLSSLIHVSLFYSLLCFILVFVEVLSEFLNLFLCLHMFFIFCVFKFFECILYILANHV